MTTTAVAGVVTAVNSGKRDAGHLEQFTTGMDFEDKSTTTNRQEVPKLPYQEKPLQVQVASL
eukprot:2482046-Amphidinium_carterae.1